MKMSRNDETKSTILLLLADLFLFIEQCNSWNVCMHACLYKFIVKVISRIIHVFPGVCIRFFCLSHRMPERIYTTIATKNRKNRT